MRILIIYHAANTGDRVTFNQHLYSFRRYSKEECYYLNTAYGIPEYINRINFDLIVYHYYFFDPNVRFSKLSRHEMNTKYSLLKQLKGYKVAIPQDEYRCTDRMNEFFYDLGIKTVFTLTPEAEWQTVFPRSKSGLEHYFTVLAGYIDELTLAKLERLQVNISHISRPIDVGYRGSSPPYWLGKAGLMKWQLTERFLNTPFKHNLKLDLSNDYKDIFYGFDWYRFLSKCRVVLGCEGGASLHDPDGSIKEKVDRYVKEHPGADFEEVEAACFPGQDGNLNLYVPSPRIFDACMTRTCQALIAGNYGGIMKPGVHYIEIKQDWSNIKDVMDQIKDVQYCEQIAANAYRDIVGSGLFTYRRFVESVMNHVKSVYQPVSEISPREAYYLKILKLRGRFPFIFAPAAFFSIDRVRYIGYRMLLKVRRHGYYKNLEATSRKITKKLQGRISVLSV